MVKFLASAGWSLLITACIFAGGAYAYWHESVYWPKHDEGHVSLSSVLLWVAAVFAIGSLIGLALGGAGSLIAKVRTRPIAPSMRAGYFIGLNVTAVAMLWLLPKMI